jgi:hypothetical protein
LPTLGAEIAGRDEEFEAHGRSSRQLSAISHQVNRIIAGARDWFSLTADV